MSFTTLGAAMAEIRPSCSLEYLSLPNTCAFSRIIYHLCTVSFVDPPWVNGVNGLDAGKDPATTDPGSVDIILALLTTATGKHMKTDMSIVVITFATGATARKVYMMRIMCIVAATESMRMATQHTALLTNAPSTSALARVIPIRRAMGLAIFAQFVLEPSR
ncbi:hypothetical protein BHE90_001154 [Fusarium euwallaceae]|uniref:Uncharacterized protein n=1 Tax=Fusarium euwallaceae TaxID=1147111 RepID=A0A430M8M3_9HYPO|nr:hypothetical protein BHE90_001154 [Fusarium euwallaceae]